MRCLWLLSCAKGWSGYFPIGGISTCGDLDQCRIALRVVVWLKMEVVAGSQVARRSFIIHIQTMLNRCM